MEFSKRPSTQFICLCISHERSSQSLKNTVTRLMPCDWLYWGTFNQAWPEGFLLSSSSFFAKKARENQWCSVKPPLLINEYFLSREGKERWREGDCTHGPELHAWPSPCAVPVNGDPSESERGGSGGWFTGWRLALENWSPSTKAVGLLYFCLLREMAKVYHFIALSVTHFRTTFEGKKLEPKILSQG